MFKTVKSNLHVTKVTMKYILTWLKLSRQDNLDSWYAEDKAYMMKLINILHHIFFFFLLLLVMVCCNETVCWSGNTTQLKLKASALFSCDLWVRMHERTSKQKFTQNILRCVSWSLHIYIGQARPIYKMLRKRRVHAINDLVGVSF